MNNNDFELDRRADVVEMETRIEARVSEDDAVVDSSSKLTNGAGDDAVGRSDKITRRGGEERMSSDSIGSEGIRVPMGLENGGVEREDLGGLNGDVDASENRISEPEDSRVSEMDSQGIQKGMDSRVSGAEFSNRNIGTDVLESRVEADRIGEKRHAEFTPRVTDDIRNGTMEHSGSRHGKENMEEVGKPNVSQYDSMLYMFDEFAANERGVAVGPSKLSSYGYEIGDLVWGKVKSHPWWPGHIYNEAFASPSVRRTKREGHILVAFFGDSSYGWFDPAELVPFDLNFLEKSRQTNSRTFMKAVEEAVDEASRRRGLGLACRCRNPYNFRPTNVQGYFAVDVGDYEPGGVYSVSQIKKARDDFQPRETLSFIKKLAVAPISSEYGSMYFIKNRATVFAYRKAVFEEFDETYAQAFGYQPVRPSREPTAAVAQSGREPSRAPLSGPLVVAEVLGKGKSSAKPNNAKDQAKKDRYLFKRRDEPNELKTHQISQGQAISSTQPRYLDDSLAIAAGDYVLQKRAPAVSSKPQIPAKHEQTGTVTRDGPSTSSQDVTGKAATTIMEKPAIEKFNMAGPHINATKVESPASFPGGLAPVSSGHLEVRSFLDKGKCLPPEMKESSGSDAAVGHISSGSSGLSGRGVHPVLVDGATLTSEPCEAMIDLKEDHQSLTAFKPVEDFRKLPSQLATAEELPGPQVQDGCSGGHPLAATDAMIHGEISGLHSDSGAKKTKVRKRPVGELICEKLVPVEKKKKKKKKKELGMEMSSDRVQMCAASGKLGASGGKVVGKSVQVALAPREVFLVEQQRKDDGASTSLLPDSIGPLQTIGTGNVELELTQLLSDLQALALDPFHGVERRSPTVIRQVFEKFRSLVYQKSLASLQSESIEVRANRSPAVNAVSDNPPVDNAGDLPSLKPPVRPDDPTKGGRKRGPSDRQEEMAAKKMKKINDLKSLAAEKKAAQKTAEAGRDGKQTVAPTPAKAVKLESSKKTDPAARAPNPTMLVMKFPPEVTLPSLNELKAKFARFGQLDHSATRVFWKSSTCRVVYRHKLDAEAAYKSATGSNNLFGNTNVRCHLRELGVPAPESETGKVQRDDASIGAQQLRDSAVEQRSAAGLTLQAVQQPVVQLKSCLKKSSGDESGTITGGNGGGRGTPRVKFMLGGEESSRAEQLTVGNKNNYSNNAIFADGGASSSTSSHGMDFISKNFQKVILPSPSPAPNLLLPTAQIPKAPNNLHYSEVAPRNAHNYSTSIAPSVPSTPSIDIAQQMLSLLTKCNDVVTNVTGMLGYVPYHPL